MRIKMFRRFAAVAGAMALLGASLYTVPMMAQGGGGGMRMSPDDRVASLDKAVTLTDEQKTKIKAIYEADMKKMMDLRNSGEDRSTMMPKMMQMRQDENTQIKALLTDDQKPKYDAYVASMRRGPGGPGGPGGGSPPSAPPQQ